MDWVVPVVLIAATAVILVLCTRAVRKALREDKSEVEPPKPTLDKQD